MKRFYVVRNLMESGHIRLWFGDADDIDHARGLSAAEIEGREQIYEELEAVEFLYNAVEEGAPC